MTELEITEKLLKEYVNRAENLGTRLDLAMQALFTIQSFGQDNSARLAQQTINQIKNIIGPKPE